MFVKAVQVARKYSRVVPEIRAVVGSKGIR